MPPCTTKRRTTTNFKTKNNQNSQRIKLYGSLTAKEVKKDSSRTVGGAETGSRDGEDSWQGSGWKTCTDEVVDGRLGEEVAGGLGGPTFACR